MVALAGALVGMAIGALWGMIVVAARAPDRPQGG